MQCTAIESPAPEQAPHLPRFPASIEVSSSQTCRCKGDHERCAGELTCCEDVVLGPRKGLLGSCRCD
eukprot:1807858-Rhodomonas_salina.1